MERDEDGGWKRSCVDALRLRRGGRVRSVLERGAGAGGGGGDRELPGPVKDLGRPEFGGKSAITRAAYRDGPLCTQKHTKLSHSAVRRNIVKITALAVDAVAYTQKS